MNRYQYPSVHSKTLDAVCGVSVYRHERQTVCIVSELPDNHGTSITNRAESVYRWIAQTRQGETVNVINVTAPDASTAITLAEKELGLKAQAVGMKDGDRVASVLWTGYEFTARKVAA